MCSPLFWKKKTLLEGISSHIHLFFSKTVHRTAKMYIDQRNIQLNYPKVNFCLYTLNILVFVQMWPKVVDSFSPILKKKEKKKDLNEFCLTFRLLVLKLLISRHNAI